MPHLAHVPHLALACVINQISRLLLLSSPLHRASGVPPEEIDAMGQDNIPLEGRSLFFFSPDNRLRAAAYDLVETQWFKVGASLP